MINLGILPSQRSSSIFKEKIITKVQREKRSLNDDQEGRNLNFVESDFVREVETSPLL